MNNQNGFAPLVVIAIVVVALAAAGVGGYFAVRSIVEVSPSQSPAPTVYSDRKILSPMPGEKWEVGKQYRIKWLPSGQSVVTLSVVNRTISSGYQFHICSPVPPYPCQLPDTGEFLWTIPPDDGHNEWTANPDYQLVLDYPKLEHIAPFIVSDNFSIVTQTADWKTYTNAKYGFELKYPPEWLSPILNDSKVNSNDPLSINLSFPVKNSEVYALQMVNVATWSSRGSVDANVAAFLTDQAWKGIVWKKKFSVDNGQAFYYINTTSKVIEPTVFLVGPSGIWLMVSEGIKYENELLSVASAFKFTK